MPPSLQLIHRLRSGHASIVWRCKDRSKLERSVVVKFIESCSDAKGEVLTIQRFWHPNVISMVDFIKWNNAFGIILHDMDMDLRHFMATELYDSVLVCDIARQCARGLHHVHEHQTLHADLKPENIGISIEKNRNSERIRIHIRLLDLGSAKLLADLTTGVEIRSTLRYQSPEKRLGVFHLPGDIYELGVVYREVSESSVDESTSPFYGGLVSDMLQPEYQLRPTSQQLLVRLEDPQIALWERLRAVTDSSVDITYLVECEDPLSFLMRDLYARMEYIVRLTISDNIQQIEKAFFLLFKTAQNEVAADLDETTQSVLQHIHHFHATVDTTWWTKLLYCMTIGTLAELPYFGLTDTMKIKLWMFSGVPTCERHVRSILWRHMTSELCQWGSEHQWGQNQVQFAQYMEEERVVQVIEE